MLNKRSGDLNILDEFTSHYSKVGQTNSVGADDKFKAFVSSFIQADADCSLHSNGLIADVHVVQEKINELKLRKAAGHDTIQNEHIVFAG